MKFSLKSIAAAVALAAVASSSFAAIDNGAQGNGELFFSIWDASNSYSRDLNIAIDSYSAANPVNIAADTALTAFLSTANVATLKWNIVAMDNQGANRLLSTATSVPVATSKNANVRSAELNIQAFINVLNPLLGVNDSYTTTGTGASWAGKPSFGANPGSLLNFTNAGTLTNNSYASGLNFLFVNSPSTSGNSVYTAYTSKAWLGTDGSIHIAAVPEPESYAMLLAGLGMIGFMARGKKRA